MTATQALKRAVWALLTLILTFLAAGGLARAGEIMGHRAIYEVELLRAQSSSGIMGARGTVYFEWGRTCEGYRINQHVRLLLSSSEGPPSATALIFSSDESADGRRMRFKMRQFNNATVTEDIEGIAERDGTGAGIIHYTAPTPLVRSMPPGTLFPTEYTKRLLDRMMQGALSYQSLVFDGSTTEGVYFVSTFFGTATEHERPTKAGAIRETVWPSRTAYFKPGAHDDAEPVFEVGGLMSAGAVAHWFDLDYGSFSVRARLTSFERLPDPTC